MVAAVYSADGVSRVMNRAMLRRAQLCDCNIACRLSVSHV